MSNIMGMVLVGERSYRIARVDRTLYQVTRILDDMTVGFFSSGPALELLPAGNECEELRAVARAAVRIARTAWAPVKERRQPLLAAFVSFLLA